MWNRKAQNLEARHARHAVPWHQQRLQKSDLLWLLALPLYEVIDTVRHEGSHALVALGEGAKINRFVVLPSIIGGQFSWGHVSLSSPTNWGVLAAPYLCDLFTFLLCFFLSTRFLFKSHWVWMNVLILGLVSPLFNSSEGYLFAFLSPGSDIAQLLHDLPPLVVHAYFILTIVFYVLGLLAILRPTYPPSASSPMMQTPPLQRRRGTGGLWIVLGLVAFLLVVDAVSGEYNGVNTAYPAAFPGHGNISLYDPLSEPDQWYQNDTGNRNNSCQYRDNAYHVLETGIDNSFLCPGSRSFRAFAFSVNMTIVKGDCGGIFFGNGGYFKYQLYICADGTYEFYFPRILQQGALNSHKRIMNTGLNQPNLVGVVFRGNAVSLFINSQQVHIDLVLPPIDSASGTIDFVARSNSHSPTEVAYTDAKVWTF